MTITCPTCNKAIGEVEIGDHRVFRLPAPDGLGFIEERKFVASSQGATVHYIEETGILSMRKHPDGSWGVECACGHNTLLHPDEEPIQSANPTS